jgi:aryl-alcohol dehydrogenase-like predicted oxidoreductase
MRRLLRMKLSRYIFGTTRLGHGDVSDERAREVARAAVAAGVWFHTSRQYDDALEILGQVYDEDRSVMPPTIYKIGGKDMADVRNVVRQNLEPLKRAHMEVGQISPGGSIGQGLVDGSVIAGFEQLREQGLLQKFVLEVFPWTSPTALAALRKGHLDGLVEAYIFYLNPLQRFASNELWDELVARKLPIIAMRTVAGGNVHRLRDVPGAAWKPYLAERARLVAPIFERSGIADWSEFCVRFAHSIPGVLATVGATSRPEGLAELLRHARDPKPLPPGIVEEIFKLQRKWSDDVDIHGQPGSM